MLDGLGLTAHWAHLKWRNKTLSEQKGFCFMQALNSEIKRAATRSGRRE
jgi:hypothetical protein